jgi:predicted DNA-binding transcriptional regulator YafY
MPGRSDRTAEAQLERILYILAAAARSGGVHIDELARELQVDAATILRDLEAVSTRAYYQPAGSVESFRIAVVRRKVYVHPPDAFSRPVRLNSREALALGLGLRALAADAEPARRAQILALAARLEAELTAPDTTVRETGAAHGASAVTVSDVEYEEHALAFDDDGFRGVVADAIQQRRCCTISYLKPGDVTPLQRRIAPYRLVYAGGRWYVAAYDLERKGLRFFRMDRVLNGTLDDGAAPLPGPELKEMLSSGVPYSASDDIEVTVRYSPSIARWIEEHTPTVVRAADGSITVRYRVADPRWIVRHVLQYGGEAVVVEPEEARRWVLAAARR